MLSASLVIPWRNFMQVVNTILVSTCFRQRHYLLSLSLACLTKKGFKRHRDKAAEIPEMLPSVSFPKRAWHDEHIAASRYIF